MKIHKTLSLFSCLTLFIMPAYGEKCPFNGHLNSPETFAQKFYGWVFFKENIEVKDMKPLSKCFEDTFYKNLLLKMSIHGDGELAEHEFDHSPFFGSNDVPNGFTILNDKISQTSTEAHVPIQFSFGKTSSSILTIDLIKQGDQWKIANIQGNEGAYDLKKEVDTAAQYLENKKNKK